MYLWYNLFISFSLSFSSSHAHTYILLTYFIFAIIYFKHYSYNATALNQGKFTSIVITHIYTYTYTQTQSKLVHNRVFYFLQIYVAIMTLTEPFFLCIQSVLICIQFSHHSRVCLCYSFVLFLWLHICFVQLCICGCGL